MYLVRRTIPVRCGLVRDGMGRDGIGWGDAVNPATPLSPLFSVHWWVVLPCLGKAVGRADGRADFVASGVAPRPALEAKKVLRLSIILAFFFLLLSCVTYGVVILRSGVLPVNSKCVCTHVP